MEVFKMSNFGEKEASKAKNIAVLTSGGDAPGMNAAIRAVVRTGIGYGMKVFGVRKGYNGLIDGDFIKMNLRSVKDIIHRGGTFLYTARSARFLEKEGIEEAVKNCKEHNIDAVVVIGGDGSFNGALALSKLSVPCIGIPATIDNDIGSTEYTVGFDTAMNTAMDMVDKLRDTAQSHNRCSVVEVMGRRSGEIALKTGIAVGATAILVPEIPFNIEKDVIKRIKHTRKTGKEHFIVVVAEGVNHVNDIAKEIFEKTGIETKATVLGHVQRGGNPTLRDRVIASEMGHYAVDLIFQNKLNRIIGLECGKVVDHDIKEALSMHKDFNMGLYKTALDISI